MERHERSIPPRGKVVINTRDFMGRLRIREQAAVGMAVELTVVANQTLEVWAGAWPVAIDLLDVDDHVVTPSLVADRNVGSVVDDDH